MTLALSVIGLMIALVVLAARLGDAQRQLDQARRESAEQARRVQEEQAAFQYGTAAALACLLAGLAAAHWDMPREAAPDGPGSRSGARAGATDQGGRPVSGPAPVLAGPGGSGRGAGGAAGAAGAGR